jgi:BatD DUF11 like domain
MSGQVAKISATLGLVLVLAPALAFAAPVTVRASVDKSVARVAEPVRLVLDVAAPQGTRVKLPKLSDHLGDFEVQKSQMLNDIPAPDNDGLRHWQLEATLETIKTGELSIPPLEVHYATGSKTAADGSTFQTLRSKPVSVQVTSVLENRPDPTKFRDIRSVVDVAVPESHSYAWVGWTTAGFGAAMAIALLAFVVVKRRRGPSAADWALASLADLERLPIEDSAAAEAAYNEVVDVVREFFELEFNVPTMSRTTREFLAQAQEVVGLGQTARERLGSLASIAAEIKFARLGVGEAQVRQAIEQARAFVGECEAHRRVAGKEAA